VKQLIFFTLQEVINARLFRLMLLAPMVLSLLALTFTGLFMLDLGKVFVDSMFTTAHILCFAFLMFMTVPFLARDIEARFTYVLLTLPINRNQYLIGRFLGLTMAFLLLISALAVVSVLSLELTQFIWDDLYMASANAGNIILGIALISCQYLSLMAVALFVFSWATGPAEVLSFTFLIWLLSWIFPPVLTAMQDADVAETVPPLLQAFLEGCYQLLPHLTGGDIANRLAHGASLSGSDISLYIAEHTAYTVILLILSTLLFRRRNL